MNGKTSKIIISTLASIVVLMAGVGITASLSRVDKVEKEIDTHERAFGHVGMSERVKNVEATVDEIKHDVKELLARP